MPTEILALEAKFWQAMCDEDIDAAIAMLDSEAAVAGMHGIGHFDHAGYKRMAEQGGAKIISFKFSDEKVIFPTPDVAIVTYTVEQTFDLHGEPHQMTSYDTTTWVRKNGAWLAAVHTETPRPVDPDVDED